MSDLTSILKKLKRDTVEVSLIESIQDRLNRITKLERDRSALLKKQADEMRQLNAKLILLQKECVHEACTYHGDPSGGSDSHSVCDICGKSDYREYRRS